MNHFLWGIITINVKLVVYNNIKEKRSWRGPGKPLQLIAKPGFYPQNVMLSVWLDYKHFKPLKPSIQYNKQTMQKERSDLMNKKGMVFNKNNSKPRTTLIQIKKPKLSYTHHTRLHCPSKLPHIPVASIQFRPPINQSKIIG